MFRSKNTPESSRRQRYVRSQNAPQPFSYRSLRSEATTPVGRRKAGPNAAITGNRKVASWIRFWGQRLGFVVGTVALIVCLFDLLALSANVKVLPADSGSQAFLLHDTATYARAANRLFADSFGNKNKVTVNTDKIAVSLRNEFPELSNVSITLPLIGHRPIVYIQANKPALILAEGNQQFLLSKDGRVEARADEVLAPVSHGLATVTDQSQRAPVKDGDVALSAAEVAFIQTVLYELQYGGIKVSALNLPAAAQELDVSVQGQPFVVKFNMQADDARQQAGTFLATWNYLRGLHTTPNEYIDVRVDGQAYYK